MRPSRDGCAESVSGRSAAPKDAAGVGGPAATVTVTLVLAAVPFLAGSFFLFQMTQLLVYAIAILGLNLLTGVSGQFSLGHGAFYGIGAYTAAILIEKAGVHYVLALPVAGGLCFVIGFLIALPTHKLEGIHLALLTFALAVATPQILKLSLLEELTGGAQGITVFPATFEMPVPFGLPLPSSMWAYYLVLVMGGLLYWAVQNIVDSRTGRAFMAIRDNPVAAQAMGVDPAVYKATAFGMSALITGIAGALGAMVVKFVAPDSFTFFLSILLFVGLVIGGVGWMPGCLIGAAAIIFLPNLAEGISKGLSGAFYGLFLILVVYFAPEGAGGLVRTLGNRIGRAWRPRGAGKGRS